MQTITAWSYLLVKQTYVDIDISIKDNREQVVGLSMFSLQSNELEMISIALLNLIRFVYNIETSYVTHFLYYMSLYKRRTY